MIKEFCYWLQSTPLAMYIGQNLFPQVESLHVVALALVFGSIALADLRLLGLAHRELSITWLHNQVLPWTWRAFIVAAITGTLMFMGNAAGYYENLPFRIKLVLLALAGLNMALFQFGTFRKVSAWDTGPVPPAARAAGVVSLVLWVGIIATGRWIGFV